MSKFNKKRASTKTVNLAGGKAFKQTNELEFVSILLTSFLTNKFYETGNETQARLIELLPGLDKKFAAQAALFARTKYGMRSVSHVIAGEIAEQVKGEVWTKNFFDKVVYRLDDMSEILSYYFSKGNKAIPNSLKKGFASAFQRFDEYQLSKYKGGGKAISLVDVVNLVHPKHNQALEKLMKGTLKPASTWEVALSASKGDKELKGKAWKDLILEKKLGYFALLRNLRNILEQSNDTALINEVVAQLIDEKKIKKSLVLPFRFLTAIKEIHNLGGINGAREVIVALNRAIDISLSNVPKFDGKTLIVLDTSGSMAGQPAEIGSLFSAILAKSNNADFMTFSDDAEYQVLNPLDSTLTISRSIHFRDGGTNFDSIFQKASKAYDRIVILSDMQGWMGSDAPVREFENYKSKFSCDPFVYSFDLMGYGTMQFPQNKIFCLAGFSEKVFDIFKVLEEDKNALLNEIRKVDL